MTKQERLVLASVVGQLDHLIRKYGQWAVESRKESEGATNDDWRRGHTSGLACAYKGASEELLRMHSDLSTLLNPSYTMYD